MRRERCWECGRPETWREWWQMRKLRRAWTKRPPSDDFYFAQWVSDDILRETRP